MTSMLRDRSCCAWTSFSRGGRRLDEVDDDDDVGAGVARDVDRDVPHHAAVREDVGIEHDGEKAPGIAMLARIAIAMSPWSRTTMSPVIMSVATARKGMGSLSKSVTVRDFAT
jgi:hypothetical protein